MMLWGGGGVYRSCFCLQRDGWNSAHRSFAFSFSLAALLPSRHGVATIQTEVAPDLGHEAL
jgi:hypothetical protein